MVRDTNAVVELLRGGADPLGFPDTAEGATAGAAADTAGALGTTPASTTTALASGHTSPTATAIRRLSPRRRQALLHCREMGALTPLDVSKIACDTFGQFKHKAFPKLNRETIKVLAEACGPWTMWSHYLYPTSERTCIRTAVLALRRYTTENHLIWKILGLTSRNFFSRPQNATEDSTIARECMISVHGGIPESYSHTKIMAPRRRAATFQSHHYDSIDEGCEEQKDAEF